MNNYTTLQSDIDKSWLPRVRVGELLWHYDIAKKAFVITSQNFFYMDRKRKSFKVNFCALEYLDFALKNTFFIISIDIL